MRVVFLCASIEEERRVTAIHGFLGSIMECRDASEAATPGFLRSIIAEGEDDLLCLVDGRAVLPSDAVQRFLDLKQCLDDGWPNWAVVGESGVSHLRYGMGAKPYVQYAADRSGGPNLAGHVLPAYGLSGNVMMVNADRVRDGSLDIDGLPPPLGVTLPVRAIQHRLAVLVAPHLACFVDVERTIRSGTTIHVADDLVEYLGQNTQNHRVLSCQGEIALPATFGSEVSEDAIDLPVESLQAAVYDRSPRSLDIVTRTRFERLPELQRTLDTVSILVSECRDLSIRHVVISRFAAPEELKVAGHVEFVKIGDSDEHDDRSTLVHQAASMSDRDLIWFLDDDDWMFPGCSDVLSSTIRASPKGATFYFDVQCFETEPAPTNDTTRPFESLSAGPRISGSSFAGNATGLNHVPFCAVIFDRSQVAAIPEDLFRRVTLYEDFALQLEIMRRVDFFPVSLELLVAGVHTRRGPKNQGTDDRTRWNESMSGLVSDLVMKPSSAAFLSLTEASKAWFVIEHAEDYETMTAASARIGPLERELDRVLMEKGILEAELRSASEGHHNALDQIRSMRDSFSWRLTRPLRVFRRLLTKSQKQ